MERKSLKYSNEKIYPDKVTTWQIQKTIEKYNLYYHPIKNEKLRRKRKLSQKKKRITELKNKTITGFFFQVDTISLFCSGLKRYIFTAIDKTSKLAFFKNVQRSFFLVCSGFPLLTCLFSPYQGRSYSD